MKRFLLVVFISALCIVFSSCHKEQNHIYGVITDMVTGEPISDVEVTLFLTKVSSSSVSTNFERYMTVTTDANGVYDMVFDGIAAMEYSLHLSKEGYHNNIHDFMPKEVAAEYNIDLKIPQASYFHFQIQKAYTYENNPIDAVRVIIEGIDPLCSECCSSDYYLFEGTDVNDDFVCNVVGGSKIKVTRYSSNKGVSSNVKIKEYDCVQNDTILYRYIY